VSHFVRPINPINPARRAQRPPGLGVFERDQVAPADLQPSLPGAFGPEQGVFVRLPGASFAPDGAVPVDVAGDANIAPGGSAAVISVTVPDTLRFRIAGIGWDAGDPAALGFLSWTIQESQVNVSGYAGMPAAIGTFRELADVFLVFGASQTITVVANAALNAVLTYRYIARLRGWFYAEKTAGGRN